MEETENLGEPIIIAHASNFFFQIEKTFAHSKIVSWFDIVAVNEK